MARKFLWVVVSVAIVVAMIWSVGWFFASKAISAALAKPDRSFGGMAANCSGPAVVGFPFRFDVDCSALNVTDASRGMTLNVPGVRASALLYRPGRVTASAVGPVKLSVGNLHLTANAGWTSAAARADLGLSGLSSFATTLETGRLVLESTTGPFLPIHVVEFQRGEIELAPSTKVPDSLSLVGTVASLHIERPNGKALPEVNATLDITGRGLTSIGSSEVAHWAASGGKIQIDGIRMSYGDTWVGVTGDLTLATSGLLSGPIRVRLSNLDDVLRIVDDLVPGWRAIANLSLAKVAERLPSFLRLPQNIDQLVDVVRPSFRAIPPPDGPAQEIDLNIKDGVVKYGIIPLGLTIPPIVASRG